MTKIGRIIALICFTLCFFSITSADDTIFNASVDKDTVAMDDTVQYTLEISGSSIGNTPGPALPQFANLRVVGSYQSSNISIVNGKVNVTKSFTYTLQPEKIGQARIDPAGITITGQTYKTKAIDLTITAATGEKTEPQPGSHSRFPGIWDNFDEFFSSPFPHFRQPEVVKDPVKVELKASRATAYVNQQIILTFTFYRRINLFQNPLYTPPDTTGFWAVNLPTDKNPREVTLNGVKYLAQDFKTALFPTTAGKFTLAPASLTVQTDPFGGTETIKTTPLEIKVLPLPEEGKPKIFNGSVGQYQMKVWLKEQKIERGKPVQITAKIEGEGNIQTISEPVIELCREFKKLSASGKEELIKGKYGTSGSKSFEIVLIPLKEGRYTLPPFEYSYFDPVKEEYRTLKSQVLSLNILPERFPLPQEYEKELAQETAKKPVAIIIPLKKIGAVIFKMATSVFFRLPGLIILAAIFTFILYKRHQKKLVADPLKLRQRQALKVARKRLKISFRLLKQNKLKEFIGGVFFCMAKYLGDKYGFSAAGITTDRLKEILSRKGLTSEVQEQLENFIFECDMLRFTPSSLDKEKAEQLARLAEKLIVMIERG